MNQSNTVNTAIIVQLGVSRYQGKISDKRMTGQLKQANHITGDGDVEATKRIMQGPEFKEASKAYNFVYTSWRELTAPWLDGGFRICPARKVEKIVLKLRELMRDADSKVDALIAVRQEVIDRDRAKLNSAFNDADYPTETELRGKFSFRLSLHPVAADFRVSGVSDSKLAEWQSQANAEMADRIREAKAELVNRMADRIGSLVKRLTALQADDGGRLHESLITNIAETASQVKDANFDEDAALDSLASKMETAFAGLDAEVLREDSVARDEAIKLAQSQLANIQTAMAGFMA